MDTRYNNHFLARLGAEVLVSGFGLAGLAGLLKKLVMAGCCFIISMYTQTIPRDLQLYCLRLRSS